jgi:hypothetical protein
MATNVPMASSRQPDAGELAGTLFGVHETPLNTGRTRHAAASAGLCCPGRTLDGVPANLNCLLHARDLGGAGTR